DVKWLSKKGVKVEVESSPNRAYKDGEYHRSGAKIVNEVKKADLIIGIKGPGPGKVLKDKIYMVFSHTTKGQPQNKPLLKKLVTNKSTLVDYEKITDASGKRLVYFGKYAGICGIVDSLFYMGRKLEWEGIDNAFSKLKPSWQYRSFNQLKKDIVKASEHIHKKGFHKRIAPFIIGITGHGNVSKGVQEILELFDPIELHPRDMRSFINHREYSRNEIYKVVFLREEKLRAKDGSGFYFEEYLTHPRRFESNLDKVLPYFNMLIHTSYWDKRYPRLVTKEMIKKLHKDENFRLQFIGDISCDIKGSIELTCRTKSPAEPVYTYDPGKGRYTDGCEAEGITLFAVDNLPAELPKDSSRDFGKMIRDYVYQISAHGVKDIADHVAIPGEIRKAVVIQKGSLTRDYSYMKKYIR
ncbi:hypothetical protein ACFL5E_04580, partial [Candidatus Omnitrophota bacterium]